jgi:hypothetical protein
MEWIPKLYDSADSAWFEMRMRLAAVSVRRIAFISALLVLLLVSPGFRVLAISAIGVFLIAERLSGLWRRPASAAPHRRRFAIRQS